MPHPNRVPFIVLATVILTGTVLPAQDRRGSDTTRSASKRSALEPVVMGTVVDWLVQRLK